MKTFPIDVELEDDAIAIEALAIVYTSKRGLECSFRWDPDRPAGNATQAECALVMLAALANYARKQQQPKKEPDA